MAASHAQLCNLITDSCLPVLFPQQIMQYNLASLKGTVISQELFNMQKHAPARAKQQLLSFYFERALPLSDSLQRRGQNHKAADTQEHPTLPTAAVVELS